MQRAGFQTQSRRVDRDVRPRFVNDADHTERHAHLADLDAAGNGWFIDATPADDSECTDGSAPAGMDLLTVVMHECGHVLGFTDLSSGADTANLMYETLSAGVRRTESVPLMETETVLATGIWHLGVSDGTHLSLDDWLDNRLWQYRV
jgi:hypothetical protein